MVVEVSFCFIEVEFTVVFMCPVYRLLGVWMGFDRWGDIGAFGEF